MLKYRIQNFLVSIVHLFLRCFFFLVLILVTFSPFFLNMYLRNLIAFSDTHVIASSSTISLFWMMPITFHIMSPSFLLYAWYFPPHRGWGRHPWERDFQESRSQKRRRRQKKFCLWLLGFVFFSLLFGLSLSGRICLTDDGRIQRYNMWNQLTEEISPEDITAVTLKTHAKDRGSGYDYSIRFFDAEEKDYWFSRGEFRFSDEKILQSLLDIKSLYAPEQITATGVEYLERVVQGCELSAEETVLLYTLFDAINQPT